MVNFIKKANAEFEQNGRSARFIAMENKIIKTGNPMFMYLFARYAKGVDVAKFQQAVIDSEELDICYYFQQNVKGSDMTLFVKKAVETDDAFWVEKFLELAIDYYEEGHPEEFRSVNSRYKIDMDRVIEYNKIGELLKGFPRRPFPNKMKNINFDINSIIEKANIEYKTNGRSKEFKIMEKISMYSNGSAAGRLFMEYIPQADITAFERVAMLKGDPFNMYWIATEIPNSNKKLMLTGLEFAKLDYVVIEDEILKNNSRKEELKQALENTKDKVEIDKLIEEYKKISNISDYIAHIDNNYITRIKHIIKTNVR